MFKPSKVAKALILEERRVARELEAAREAVSVRLLAESGYFVGDLIQLKDSGLMYKIERMHGSSAPYSTQDFSVMFTTRRFYRQGRRAGRTANSTTHIWLSDNVEKVHD